MGTGSGCWDPDGNGLGHCGPDGNKLGGLGSGWKWLGALGSQRELAWSIGILREMAWGVGILMGTGSGHWNQDGKQLGALGSQWKWLGALGSRWELAGVPQKGAAPAPSPKAGCLQQVAHRPVAWLGFPSHPGMHPPNTAGHCSCGSGRPVGKRRPGSPSITPCARQRGEDGRGMRQCQRAGRWSAWWDGRERRGQERRSQRGCGRVPQLPTPLCREVQPCREGPAGGRLPAPITHHRAALRIARISPS